MQLSRQPIREPACEARSSQTNKVLFVKRAVRFASTAEFSKRIMKKWGHFAGFRQFDCASTKHLTNILYTHLSIHI